MWGRSERSFAHLSLGNFFGSEYKQDSRCDNIFTHRINDPCFVNSSRYDHLSLSNNAICNTNNLNNTHTRPTCTRHDPVQQIPSESSVDVHILRLGSDRPAFGNV